MSEHTELLAKHWGVQRLAWALGIDFHQPSLTRRLLGGRETVIRLVDEGYLGPPELGAVGYQPTSKAFEEVDPPEELHYLSIHKDGSTLTQLSASEIKWGLEQLMLGDGVEETAATLKIHQAYVEHDIYAVAQELGVSQAVVEYLELPIDDKETLEECVMVSMEYYRQKLDALTVFVDAVHRSGGWKHG